jgi:antitoxin component YwqK of YwqJK toxin-antitoxin module
MNFRALSIIFFFALGCSDPDSMDDKSKRNENWAWFVDQKTGVGEWVELSYKSTIDEGEYVFFYSNGNRRQTGKLKQGIDCDTVYRFDIHGQPQNKYIRLHQDSTVLNIWPDGPFKAHYSTCELAVEGKRLNNALVDTCIDYFRSGKVRTYSFCRKDTVWREDFHENGVLLHKGVKIAKLIDGADTVWYPSGTLKEVWFYSNGKEYGESRLYYPSGALRHINNYDNGKAVGLSTSWYENGHVDIIQNFVNGQNSGMYEDYYPNGVLCKRGNMVNNEKHGLWTTYYDNGTISSKGYYQNNHTHGTTRYFTFTGKLWRIAEYEHGKEVSFEEPEKMTKQEEEKWEEHVEYMQGVSKRNKELESKFNSVSNVN